MRHIWRSASVATCLNPYRSHKIFPLRQDRRRKRRTSAGHDPSRGVGPGAEFIALWTEGSEIAQCLGIPKGTVQSRAHCLQQRGMIQSRPKGIAYQSQRANAGLTHTRAETRASIDTDVIIIIKL